MQEPTREILWNAPEIFRRHFFAILDFAEFGLPTGPLVFHLVPGDGGMQLIPVGEGFAIDIPADETTLPTLAPGSGSAKTAWLWAYARDDRTFGGSGPPMVAYRFEDSRAGECVARHLNGYRGILQVDGYAGYGALAATGASSLPSAGRWRRRLWRFHEIAGSGTRRSSARRSHASLRSACSTVCASCGPRIGISGDSRLLLSLIL